MSIKSQNNEIIISSRNISEIMSSAYQEYGMMVISERAISSVMDGLKPVQRRIIYVMYLNNNNHSHAYKKCASIVGDTMSKFHPHGNESIYAALVHMKQEFVMLHPLIDGQGNFGSHDDNAAAFRYTEARLTKLSKEFFLDSSKTNSYIHNVVPMKPNYDDTTQEPLYLPTTMPLLFMNGTQGIAVGIATRIPPHNLTELCNAIIATIHNENITVSELMENYIYGPDFPEGDTISSKESIRQIYEQGHGKLILSAQYHFEEDTIIFTSIPYSSSKLNIIDKIKALIEDKKLHECVWVRDETSRQGLRIVVKLTNIQHSNIMLNTILKFTSLRMSYSVLCYALNEDNQVKLYTLKDYIKTFINFQHSLLIQQATYDYTCITKSLHLLIGKITAIGNMEEIIHIIKTSANKEIASQKLLSKKWKIEYPEIIKVLQLPSDMIIFSTDQLNSILNMRLRELVTMTASDLLAEMNKLLEDLLEYERILYNIEYRKKLIENNLLRISKSYGKERKSKIEDNYDTFNAKDFVIAKSNLIMLTEDQFIKKINIEEFNTQHRSGLGKQGGKEIIQQALMVNDRDTLLLFSKNGIAYNIDSYRISPTSYANKGRSITQLLPILSATNDNIICMQNIEENATNEFIVFISESGYVRKNYAKDFANLRINGKIYNKSKVPMVNILLCNDQDCLMLATENGQVITLEISAFRTMQQHNSSGVIAARLKSGDKIIKAIIVREKDMVLSILNNGYGRISNLSQYKVYKNRGGVGISNISAKLKKSSNTMADIIAIRDVDININSSVLIMTNTQQIIRIPLTDIKESSRTTRGTKLLNNKDAICFSAVVNN